MRAVLLLSALVVACTSASESEPVPDVATGELEAWVAGPALPTARANACSAAVGDWVLVIGGNHARADGTFVKTDEIHAARMGSDGVLGAWQLAGRTPSPVSECTATADGERLYVVDGLYDVETDARQVLTATVDGETGMLMGPLVAMTTLPDIAISSEAAVRGGALLMMDTVLPMDGDKTVTLRTAAAGGGAWSTDDWGIGFRAQAQYAFGDGFAWTLGGYGGAEGNPVSDEVFVATIGGDGAVGVGRPTTKLPAPTAFGEAAAVDDFVFVVGGRPQVFGGQASSSVYAAHVGVDGGLEGWTTLAALPMARTNHELVVVGDYLVIAGGASEAGGDANVMSARVRFPANR